jgi:hypothetical protein
MAVFSIRIAGPDKSIAYGRPIVRLPGLLGTLGHGSWRSSVGAPGSLLGERRHRLGLWAALGTGSDRVRPVLAD